MPTTPDTSALLSGFSLLNLVQETFVALCAILLATGFHGAWSSRILFHSEGVMQRHLAAKRFNRVILQCYLAVLGLVLVHLAEIGFWGLSLLIFDLTDNLLEALLIAGSTYTTVGFESDSLRPGWKLYMIFIAVSGLFNFAWSTSTLMTLFTQGREAYRLKLRL